MLHTVNKKVPRPPGMVKDELIEKSLELKDGDEDNSENGNINVLKGFITLNMHDSAESTTASLSSTMSNDSSSVSPLTHHHRVSSTSSLSSSIPSNISNSPTFFKSVVKCSSLPSFKPQDSKYMKPAGAHLITNVEFGKILESTSNDDLLILDIRPFIEYSKGHIKGSLHILLPSTLLRRRNFTLEKLLDNLTADDQSIMRTKLTKLGKSLRIIIYDNTNGHTEDSISLACYGISTKLMDYIANSNDDNPSSIVVSILASGFNQFSLIFPDCIHYDVYNNDENTNINFNDNNIGTINNFNSTQYNSGLNSPHINLRLNVPEKQNKAYSPSFGALSDSPTPASSKYLSMLNESPISSSSPISALLKFQLPSNHSMPSTFFKISQNEESMNIESYLSAVNIKEEHITHQENLINDKRIFNSFEFPKRETSPSPLGPPDTRLTLDTKLRFQKKYDEVCSIFLQEEVDTVIPTWFQHLMKRSKLEFISQFQKLDFLERKRLNNCLRRKTSYSISTTNNTINKRPTTPLAFTQFRNELIAPSINPFSKVNTVTLPDTPTIQKRSLSHPNILNDIILLPSPRMALDYDEDDELISISSGVELGSKNRYKDIFPYEHSRVVLRKFSFSAITNIDTISDDISENYINANYLNLPKFTLPNVPEESKQLNDDKIYSTSRKLRYIATQAPLLSTVRDFYTCIINNNVPLILSLTDSFENGVEKCFQFWEEGNYDGIEVKLLEAFSVSATFEDLHTVNFDGDQESTIFIRRIQLSYMIDDKRFTFETMQYQIKNWLDLGTLLDPTEIIQIINLKNYLINNMFEAQLFSLNEVPTILVHCSAGCGRTGTWCTVDSILSNLNMFEALQSQSNDLSSSSIFDPIVWTINMFRKQRISMVQNINQFLFIYEVLLYYFSLKLYERRNTDKLRIPNRHKHTKSMETLINQIHGLNIINKFVDGKTQEPICSLA